MDLPKNITQIGESDQRCKVYVEDYVISYIKQMNRLAENRNVAVALYGIRKEENGVSYVFFYGAGKVHSIQKEVRHLSQAQNQEIEKLRKRFFSEYQFLGYRMLSGEMVEGFHICEQGTCRYINGYACFYEKNDVMLAYMLDSRKEEAPPESVDQEKYDRVRKRQEERRAQYRGSLEGNAESVKEPVASSHQARKELRDVPKNSSSFRKVRKTGGSLKMMRVAVVGMFLLLCVLGFMTLNDSYTMEDIQTAARKLITDFTEQKIPDNDTEQDTSTQVNTLVAEDKLTEAIRQENAAGQEMQQPETNEMKESQTAETQPTDDSEQDPSLNPTDPSESHVPDEQTQVPPEPTGQPEPSQQTSAPVSYTIKKGDTLTAISVRIYGTDARVKDICTLNNIKNPDDIQFGQKILLP